MGRRPSRPDHPVDDLHGVIMLELLHCVMPLAERRAKIALLHDLEGQKIGQRTQRSCPHHLVSKTPPAFGHLLAEVLSEIIHGERPALTGHRSYGSR